MKIYFDNDGSFGPSLVQVPIVSNGSPIGLVESVSEETVTCLIFDRYISVEQIGFDKGQNIRAIHLSSGDAVTWKQNLL